MGNRDCIIELKEISFSYKGREPLFRSLDFRLEPGERVGLVGSNGSGKTTLFRIIMGLLKPSSGEVIIYGKPRRKEEDFREVREKIGLLFQDPDDQLFSPTVEEDVAFGPLNLGKGKEEVRAIVRETLDMLRLKGFEHRITYQLSGGEKRLVSLATVLAMKPQVLLLDEPTSGLDEEVSAALVQILKSRSRTHVVISHDSGFLGEVTDKVLELRQGRLWPLS